MTTHDINSGLRVLGQHHSVLVALEDELQREADGFIIIYN